MKKISKKNQKVFWWLWIIIVALLIISSNDSSDLAIGRTAIIFGQSIDKKSPILGGFIEDTGFGGFIEDTGLNLKKAKYVALRVSINTFLNDYLGDYKEWKAIEKKLGKLDKSSIEYTGLNNQYKELVSKGKRWQTWQEIDALEKKKKLVHPEPEILQGLKETFFTLDKAAITAIKYILPILEKIEDGEVSKQEERDLEKLVFEVKKNIDKTFEDSEFGLKKIERQLVQNLALFTGIKKIFDWAAEERGFESFVSNQLAPRLEEGRKRLPEVESRINQLKMFSTLLGLYENLTEEQVKAVSDLEMP